MASQGKKITVYVRKSLVFPFRISYRFAQDYPFLLGMVFFLYILYRYCPALFAFLVSSSPVLVCTTLLLGILLVYGEPNICETEEDKRQDISSTKCAVKMQDISSLKGSVNVNDDAGPMVKMDKSNLEGHFDSSCKPVEDHDRCSGSESDAAENSSPDASVADIIPMVDELHPLLNCEAPQPAHKLIDKSDAGSSGNSQDNESDDDSAEEEAENQEDEEDEEEQEKDDTIEAVVTWTADDQKNLMYLGTSEIERNQRLENLIAKRRARKFLSFHVEKNLIDLDSTDPMPNTDDLSHFQCQIPSISAPRHNPFDLPFDTEETAGLPPIPCSAPSVMQPRRNPFDFPLQQFEDSDNLSRETMNHQEFSSAAQREMFHQRHESLTLGASFSGDCMQESHDSKLKPYFFPEGMHSEGIGLATSQRQSSGKSNSKASSTHESDTNSSIVDQENHVELLEEFHMESHVLPPENHCAEPVEQGSQSSEEVDSVVAEHEDVDDDRAIHLNSSTEGNHQATDAFGAVEMEIRQGDFHSTDPQAENLEVIEERYDDSSSSSSEAYDKNSKMSIDGNAINLEQTRNDAKDSSDSVLSVPADSDMSNITKRFDDTQTVDPVYDSSPSAVEKSHSNMSTFDESLLFAGKKEVSSNNLVASDVQIGSSQLGSSQTVHEKKGSSEGSGFVPVSKSIDGDFSSTTELWVAPRSLAAVDDIESRAKEVSEISEQDGIHVFSHLVAPLPPEAIYPSHLSTVDDGSNKNLSVEVDVTNNAAASSNPSKSGLPHTPQEMPVTQQPERAAVKDSDIGASDVSLIPKSRLKDFRLGSASSSGLTGLQLIAKVAGDKLEGKVSNFGGKSTLGKVQNITKFW